MGEKETGIAVKISYWIYEREDIGGIEDFRKELLENYIASIRGEPCYDKGGGLYNFFIELISQITLSEFSKSLLAGVAYDAVKGFILRPLLDALKKLLGKKPSVKIDKVQIYFQDTKLIISPFSFEHFEKILRSVAENYRKLFLPKGEYYSSFLGKISLSKGEYPSAIYIPIFYEFGVEDTAREKGRIFRGLTDVDEFISPNFPADYFGFWGVEYSIYMTKVYDFKEARLLDETFSLGDYYFPPPRF